MLNIAISAVPPINQSTTATKINPTIAFLCCLKKSISTSHKHNITKMAIEQFY